MSSAKCIITVLSILLLCACKDAGSRRSATDTRLESSGLVGISYHVYATNESSGDLSVIDAANNVVIGRVTLGKRPRGIRVSPDGRTLFVALSGSPMAPPGVDEDTLPPADKSADGIGIVDVATRRLVRTLRGVSDPEQVAIGRDGHIYVASEDSGTAVIMDAGGGILARLFVGGEPEGVAVSPDGRWAYVTSEEDAQVAVIDTDRKALAGIVKVGSRPRSVAFSPDGRLAFVTGETDGSVTAIDTATRRVVGRTTLSDRNLLPMDAIVSPDGGRLYVSTGRGGAIVALDARSLRQTGIVRVGQRPWGMALSPDGRRLYSANGPSDDVSVVDTASFREVGRVKVGARPWGVAVAPDPMAGN